MSAAIIPFPNARARPAGEMSQRRVVELAVGVAAQAHPSGFMDEMVRRIEKLRAQARREDLQAACAAHYGARAAEQSKQD